MELTEWKNKGVTTSDGCASEQKSELNEYYAEKRETMKKKITIWDRWNKDKKKYEFNHFDDEWVKNKKPIPKSDYQKKSWNNSKWNKTYGYLVNNNVVRIQEA
jgi:hypothetical protein